MIRVMNKGSILTPDASAQELCSAAVECYNRRDDAGAARLARLALRQEPNHGLALALLAMTQVKYGDDRPAALDHARRAIEAAPDLLLAHCAMGQACRDLGLLTQAIGHLRDAVKRDPNNSEVLRQLGMPLVQGEFWREGWSYYERRPTIPYANQYQKPDPQGVPEWRGEDLTGKALIVLGENGHGDQIQS